MLFLSLSRITKFSLQNFARNIWLSMVTITIIVLTLFSVTSLVFINAVMNEAISLVKSKVDVSVYFKPTATEEQIAVVQQTLEDAPYVVRVAHVTKSEALAKLREQYKNSPLILESLKELANNPLGDTLIVNTADTSDYQKVIDILNATPQFAVLIDNQSFDDNSYVIEKLEQIAGQLERIGWGVTLFFGLISLIVIVNTIRIAIYTHRDEIGIMKLVGASNSFIRGPFVGEAILYAMVGSGITFVLGYAAATFSDPYVVGLLGPVDFTLLSYLNQNVALIFGGELLGIILISVFATSLALRRYMRV
ncbi:MAG: ABC transporter permease [Parcubacteria group bacterium]|nr:ABC transporter permease [Parcubacteria group bacterium]